MTIDEAIKMAKADLKCMERDTSGQDEMCNSHKCDECSLNYERGNMGEQKEWLRMAIKALEQEPCEDAVSVASVFEIMGNLMSIPYDFDRIITEKDVSESMDEIRELPRVTPQEPKWIPVTERLPEEEGFYLVTRRITDDVATFIFRRTPTSKDYWKRCVTAWKPLPQPYKAESEG